MNKTATEHRRQSNTKQYTYCRARQTEGILNRLREQNLLNQSTRRASETVKQQVF